jgi:hypothetical protein
MAKYRRFVGNPKESKQRRQAPAVRNRLLAVNFGPPLADRFRPFAGQGERTANAAVTDPSRNVAQPRGFPADSE